MRECEVSMEMLGGSRTLLCERTLNLARFVLKWK